MESHNMKKTYLYSAIIATCMLLNTSTASAILYSVVDIEGDGNPANVTTATNQLSVDITDPGSGQILFTFTNIGPSASSITQIYFEQNSFNFLYDLESLNGSTGVDFIEATGNLGRPPGAENIGWANNATAFRANADNPVQPNGINPGESLGILFSLTTGHSFGDVVCFGFNEHFWGKC